MSSKGEKLPLRVKLAYGAPSFAGAGMAIPIAIHLTIFYSDVILVPLGLIALVKAVARALDAITDPVMGWLTDSTRSRWGRRRPWILFGAPAAALSFYLMFTPPEALSGANAAAWFATTYVCYYLFHTVYVIPHYGLGAELTLDYNDRSMLFGIREAFVVLGTLVAAVAPPIFIQYMGGPRAGYSGLAALLGVLLVGLYVNLVAQVKERPDFIARPPNPLVPGLRRVFRNRAFRILLAVYLTGAITGAIPGLMMPYFTKYVLMPDNPDAWLAIFLAVYFGAGFLCLPLWIWLARRFEKKPVWLASFVPGVTGSLGLFLMGPGDLWPTFCVLAWAGSAFGAGLFLGPAMQADVIDYDELYTGKRREAQYGALWSIMSKFVVIPSMSIPLAILATVGYMPNVPQTETVQFTIRAIFGLGPASAAAIAFCVGTLYPISRKVHEQIWEGIEQLRRGEAATDPINGHRIPPYSERHADEDDGWYLDHYTTGELKLVLQRGIDALRRRILLLQAASGVALVVSCLAVAGEVHLDSKPGIMAVLYVVAAGLAIAALGFHFVRWRAVGRLKNVDTQTIESHIRINQLLKGDGIALPSPA
ncbi:MAG: MFS transporter [Pseudomonadales bacterium]|jgi:GPH family glycoside/pentoside/hexuronide:cation symporter